MSFIPVEICPVCGRMSGKCKLTDSGLLICRDANGDLDGKNPQWEFIKQSNSPEFGLYRRTDQPFIPREDLDATRRTPEDIELERELARLGSAADYVAKVGGPDKFLPWDDPIAAARLNPTHVLHRLLGIPTTGFDDLDVMFLPNDGLGRGWPCYTFPMRNGKGEIVGYSLRYRGGQKLCGGSNSGMFIPASLARRKKPGTGRGSHVPRSGEPIYIVEGASDTLTLLAMHLRVMGRPSVSGGAEYAAEWVQANLPQHRWDFRVVVENDRRVRASDGKLIWPGLEHSLRWAEKFGQLLGISVDLCFTPDGAKDARTWYREEIRKGKGRTPGGLGTIWGHRCWLSVYHVRPGVTNQTNLEGVIPCGDEVQPEKACVRPYVAPDLTPIIKALVEDIRQARERGDIPNPYEEETAAKQIATCRRDFEQYPCQRCRGIALGDRQNGGVVLMEVRCERRDLCDGCRKFLNDREMFNARLRFHAAHDSGQGLFEANVSEEDWPAIARRLRRARAQYLRCHEDGQGYYVVASKQTPGFIAVGADLAVSVVEELLGCYRERARPIATSHGWRLPRDESSGDLERLGKAAPMSPAVIEEIASMVGATAMPWTPRVEGRTRRIWRFIRPGGWLDTGGQDAREWLVDCLFLGEALPRIQVNFGSRLGRATAGAAVGAGDDPLEDSDPYHGDDPWS
jgi:hypothetical protein